MADDKAEADKNYPSEHLRTGSDRVSSGLLQLSSGLKLILKSIWRWFDNHPKVKWLVGLPVGAVIGDYLLELVGNLRAYYFGYNVTATTDIEVETFPLPLGLSLRILSILWILITIIMFIKFVELRKRVEHLEDES